MSDLPTSGQDPDEPWGAEPADRWVMIRAESCAPALWQADGMARCPDDLPPIPPALAARIERLATWYDEIDAANDSFPRPQFWEQRTDATISAFNAEGRALAHALKAALPPDWTVVYEDVDAWLRPKDEALAMRQLVLAGTGLPAALS